MAWVAAIALFLGVLCMSLNMRNAWPRPPGNPGRVPRWLDLRVPDYFYDPVWAQALVSVNMLVAVYFGSLGTWSHLSLLEHPTRGTANPFAATEAGSRERPDRAHPGSITPANGPQTIAGRRILAIAAR